MSGRKPASPQGGPPSGPTAIDERRMRAISEPLDVRWLAREPYPRVEVRNPARKTRYLTLWPEYPDRSAALCTCPDFARRGLGDCKHLEAAWRWLAHASLGREPPAPVATVPEPESLWEAVERRLASPPPLSERSIRELAEPGRLFFERARRAG